MMSPTHERLDYLDAVRAFALLLGIVFHAGMSFLPIYIGWAVMDVSTSQVVAIFTTLSHSFRMPLFFLVAGFFGRMTLERRGSGAFIRSRLWRLALPFVAGWFVLRPLLVAGWILGAQSLRGEVDSAAALRGGLATLDRLPAELFVGTHLWFLYYLLLVTGSLLLLRSVLQWVPRVAGPLARRADRCVSRLVQAPLGTLLLAVPTAGCLLFMEHWGLDTPDRSLRPSLPVLLIYGGCFFVGWLLHRQPRQLERFSSLSALRVVIAVAALVATLQLARFETAYGHPQYRALQVLFALSYAITLWSLVQLCIGTFRRLFRAPNRVVRYLADASYWLYLVHLPIVVWLQVAVAEIGAHWSIKLAGISVATVLLSLVIYDLCVRATVVGALLNGRRRPRLLFAARERKGCSGMLREDAKPT